MATLKDIAAIAGVRVSTVSKALRNSSDLSPKTVLNIRRIADELSYPYLCADRESEYNKMIGVVSPELGSSYYMGFNASLRAHLNEKGFETLIMASDFSAQHEAFCIETLIGLGVRAVIVNSETRINVEKYQNISETSSVPMLLITNFSGINFCDNICIDDDQGVALAVNHLIDYGHRDIAYIGESLTQARRAAFLRSLATAGIELRPEYIVEQKCRFELCGYQGMKELLALPNPPTAVFASYDNIAIGAMKAIYEAKKRIPEDISIVGVDNIETSSYLSCSLTTVTMPTFDLGELCSELMLDKLTGAKRASRSITLKPTLNIRESTCRLHRQV